MDNGLQFPSAAGPICQAPYIPLAISLVVSIADPPVSTAATGELTSGTTEVLPSEIGLGAPSIQPVMDARGTRQNVSPSLDETRSINVMVDGSNPGTRFCGWRPMARREGIRELPGRSRDIPKKRCPGAVSTGVRPKTFC